MDKNENKEKQPLEECPWCDTTGDVEKNRGIYWTVVFVIVTVITLLYILTKFI
ncbi:MAG: hypothetical protein GXO97_06905 [Nitrospirae bacterium]|nr:hypothetical protein [Nitrospirota bacterium]